MSSQASFTLFFQEAVYSHLRPYVGTSELQSIQSIFQQRLNRLSDFRLFQVNYGTVCASCSIGSKAFTVMVFVLRVQYNGLRYDPVLTAARFSILPSLRKMFFTKHVANTHRVYIIRSIYCGSLAVINDITLPNSNTRRE